MPLTRTPYGATSRIGKNASAHLDALLDSNDVADDAILNGGHIRVMQDVRGKHGSPPLKMTAAEYLPGRCLIVPADRAG
jgi:predicted acyl esterase